MNNAAPSSDLREAKHLASTAHVLAIVTLIGLGIYIAVRVGFPVGNALFNSTITWGQAIHNIGLILVSLLPAGLFYEALNELRRALHLYRGGEFFSSLASSHVAKAGNYAVAATISAMLIVPNLTLWIEGNGGAHTRIEPELIGLLTLALFVSVVGRVLAAASQLKTENDSFV